MQVLGGLWIHQTRVNNHISCTSRFIDLIQECDPFTYRILKPNAQVSLDGFGRDPTFNPLSRLFMEANEGDYYNTTAGSSEVDSFGYPYGFFKRKVTGHNPGYPVVIQVGTLCCCMP